MPLGKRTDYGDARFAGVSIPFATDVEEAVKVGAAPTAVGVLACTQHSRGHPASCVYTGVIVHWCDVLVLIERHGSTRHGRIALGQGT